MSIHPSPTYNPPDQTPAWVHQLRGVLRDRDLATQAPVISREASDEIAKADAFAWLGNRAADGARDLQKLFGNQAGLRFTWNMSSGVDPVPTLTMTVFAGQDHVFTYHLRLGLADGVIKPFVTTRVGLDTATQQPFLPWIHSGGNLQVISPDDVAADFSRLFAELTP
jgi:hypothetical protein